MDLDFLKYVEGFVSENRLQKFESVLDYRSRFITVAVEDVYHLHNTSAVIRSCDAFGIQDIHIIEERNRRRIDREIALGSQKWVTPHRHHTSKDCIEQLKASGYKIIATLPHETGRAVSEFEIADKCCFFFGSEQKGLTEHVIEKADGYIHIPMVGFTQSLNISVSAAIVMQTVAEKLRKSDLNWKLSSEERNELKMSWLKEQLKDFDAIRARFYQLK